MDKQTIALQIFKEYWKVFSTEFSLQGKNMVYYRKEVALYFSSFQKPL